MTSRKKESKNFKLLLLFEWKSKNFKIYFEKNIFKKKRLEKIF